MTGAMAIAEALDRGGRVEWSPAERPRLLVPRSLRPKVEANRETVREVLRRAVIFREQAEGFMREGQCFPPFYLPYHPGDGPGLCTACGAPLSPGRWCRCEVCDLAVRIVLDLAPREASR